MPILKTCFTKATLRDRLVRERPGLSLAEGEIAAISGEIVRHRQNWVSMWVDHGHSVRSECGTMTARRGITRDGRLLWLVSREGKARDYHATAHDPVAAFAQADAARAKRRAVRARWGEVRALRRDLLLGRKRFDVTLEDAAASPLCVVGIQGFMRAIGLGRVRCVPGRVAALMMLIEPQVGFVIHEAALRHRVLGQARHRGAPAGGTMPMRAGG